MVWYCVYCGVYLRSSVGLSFFCWVFSSCVRFSGSFFLLAVRLFSLPVCLCLLLFFLLRGCYFCGFFLLPLCFVLFGCVSCSCFVFSSLAFICLLFFFVARFFFVFVSFFVQSVFFRGFLLSLSRCFGLRVWVCRPRFDRVGVVVCLLLSGGGVVSRCPLLWGSFGGVVSCPHGSVVSVCAPRLHGVSVLPQFRGAYLPGFPAPRSPSACSPTSPYSFSFFFFVLSFDSLSSS